MWAETPYAYRSDSTPQHRERDVPFECRVVARREAWRKR